ncbi:MAG: SpoIIE family protein phosphatase [Candidatus Goldiibacteriota bacterium]
MKLKNKNLAEYSFVYPAKTPYVNDVKSRFVEICKENNFSYKDMNNILIVIDEVCANIIKHAYRDKEGDMAFEVVIRKKGMYMTIIDKGRSFNWYAFKTPNINRYVNIGKKGGLGLWIIRKLTNKNDYKTTERGNELTLVKYHTKPSLAARAAEMFRPSRSIKEKFIFTASIFIFLLIGGVYLYFLESEKQGLKEKFMLYNAEMVQSLSQSTAGHLLKSNYLPVISLLKEIKENNSSIDEIYILNNDGFVVAHNNAEMLYKEKSLPAERTGSAVVDEVRVLFYKEKNGEAMRFVEPLYFQGRDLGELHLYISAESMSGIFKGKRVNYWIALGVIFVVAALGIYFLIGLITGPINSLREGVMAIGEGRLDHRIEMEGEDEFSQIANAFNDMAKKFKGAQASLIEQERVQKEIAVAKEIQHTLLPKDIPDTGGFDIASLYRSAKDVGGDYYDIMKVTPGHIGVMVADVAGKGVPGSLVMTITRTAVRLVAQGNKSARNVLVKVNNFVKEDMKKGMFVTAFYLVLDSISRKINFASAGHDPLLLYRAKEEKVYWVKPKGFPLGISLPDESLFGKVMVEESLKLRKDDMLLVYTDGITEAMNGQREQFGEKRFVAAVKKYGRFSSAEFIEKLDEEIKGFTKGYPQNDDITIVAIKEKKTDNAVLKKIERDILKLRKKGMKSREIEKELGIDMKAFKKIKAQKKASKGGKRTALRYLAFEEKKELMKKVIEHPEWSIPDFARKMSKTFGKKIDVKLIENEFKRVNLSNVSKRKKYSNERR